MKTVIAIDSFKGSLTSLEAGNAVKRGFEKAFGAEERHAYTVKPLADGGEGTTEALTFGLGGELEAVRVTAPLWGRVDASYGVLPDKKTAVMEMASAAGIVLCAGERLDPHRATTFGVGEMILDAAGKGCRDFLVGIGGSAGADCGVGMLRALGYTFLDKDGNDAGKDAGDIVRTLGAIEEISDENVSPLLSGCRFSVACDVTNPLCGEAGSVRVFGAQKGIREDEMQDFDDAFSHFAAVCARHFGKDLRDHPGAGAAGGLGFAFLTFLHGELTSGSELVIRTVGLEEDIKDCDLVITGEGRLDGQTAMGKLPVGVAALAKRYGKPCIAFAGGVTRDAHLTRKAGIDAYFPAVRGVCALSEAMEKENALYALEDSAEQAARLIRCMGGK